MSKREDAWVGCPFYKHETQQVIHCEGVEDGASTNMAFSTVDKKRVYKAQFCKKEWKKCKIAEMLNRKYE